MSTSALANGIRGYTNKVHLSCGTLRERGLIQNQGFLTHVRPWRSAGKVGLACVVATSSRPILY
ncbi:MAG: hypothetical protein V7L14_17765 [Nostoc sp.]|uniref:hypothetical protein n=1 Tax=Nostoc sp. TaxID=1180 RepID=UPI002FFC1F24